jgi:hypothetical protein
LIEVNGRRVNEAIERGLGSSGSGVFLCECGQVGCNTTIELSLAEYDAIRTGFERFLVAPGHEIDRIDFVVERHNSYLVVEKRAEVVKRAMAQPGSDDPNDPC